MDYVGIEIGRVWDYENDDGWFSANNGSCHGKIRTDWEVEYHFIKMGKALSRFPKRIPSQYSREIGGKDAFPYLVLRAHADNLLHVNLEVMMKGIDEEADRPRDRDIFAPSHLSIDLAKSQTHNELGGEVLVSFEVEPSAIHQLGELLIKYSEKHRHTGSSKYRILRWSPNPDNDALIEFDLPKLENYKSEPSKLDPALKEWERLRRKHLTTEEIERKEIARKIIEEREGPKQRWELPG